MEDPWPAGFTKTVALDAAVFPEGPVQGGPRRARKSYQ